MVHLSITQGPVPRACFLDSDVHMLSHNKKEHMNVQKRDQPGITKDMFQAANIWKLTVMHECKMATVLPYLASYGNVIANFEVKIIFILKLFLKS